ncbi:MAG TPA: hypothetical protein VLV86_26055, partial [Vicinamibacterales bacterium]|nr:hypothetical protein [Vicinamibacterales bacterium]
LNSLTKPLLVKRVMRLRGTPCAAESEQSIRHPHDDRRPDIDTYFLAADVFYPAPGRLLAAIAANRRILAPQTLEASLLSKD